MRARCSCTGRHGSCPSPRKMARPDGIPPRDGMVSRSAGRTRWQSVAVVETESLGDQLKDLASAFDDPTKRDLLLQKTLSALADQLYSPMGRGRFREYTHQWRKYSNGLY